MTAKELFEFAKKYNLEDAELVFQDVYKCRYGINNAILDVEKKFQEQNKIIISE